MCLEISKLIFAHSIYIFYEKMFCLEISYHYMRPQIKKYIA